MPAILIVDDRPQNLLALEAILEPLQQEFVSAGSGVEALRALLLRDDFAVILLDVQMPGMDGFETAELIKQRERTKNIPIIFVTAISKEERHVFRGYETGAVDYVFKPFEPEILRAKVSVFVELWEKNEQLRTQAELLALQELAAVRRESAERYRQLADAMSSTWSARCAWATGSAATGSRGTSTAWAPSPAGGATAIGNWSGFSVRPSWHGKWCPRDQSQWTAPA